MTALGRPAMVVADCHSGWRPPIAIALIAAVTMTLGNVAAIWQDEVRRMLGWSAVSQTGHALMAIVVLGRRPPAIPALLNFLAAYALGTLAAFGVGAGMDAGYAWLAAVAIAKTVMSVFHCLRVLAPAYFDHGRGEPAPVLGQRAAVAIAASEAGCCSEFGRMGCCRWCTTRDCCQARNDRGRHR